MPIMVAHQNMRIFGGGSELRKLAYKNAFKSMDSYSIDIIGFTEVTNNGASRGALADFAKILFEGATPGHTIVVASGITALARNYEYIGISIRPGIRLIYVCRVLLQVSGSGVTLTLDKYMEDTDADFASWSSSVPNHATADYRHVVFIIVENSGQYYAVGFLHNRYSAESERIIVANQIPNMLNLMASAVNIGGIEVEPIPYLLGDFNLEPAERGNAVPIYNETIPTTEGDHIYDYAYVRSEDLPPITPTMNVNQTTMDVEGRVSNHSLICLELG